MRFDSVEYEVKGTTALVTLDEPSKLNALSPGIRSGLTTALAQADDDPAVRVIIITGAGEKSFCAGADISGFEFTTTYAKQFIDKVLDVLALPENTSKPVIAAVNGYAFGGGFEISIACDFVIASEQAKFGVPEIQLGLLPGFAIVRLAELVGRQMAKYLSMLGEPVSAQEAKELGLVLKVVPHEQLLEQAFALADKLASKPQMAIRYAKSVYNRELGGADVTYAKDVMPFLFLDEDTREGVTAFREKRKPEFK
ncbi:MAG: enoyl-CoA hydratase/isomerase family protein [Gammaproteobacteria bacterium]|nr:MAG: enoyl-CoA hydratase/isomerase family protein [Gammaproteobacteria bacterium]RLA52983.1 MAG: enoyl-CoA hydratase/isomerase family protein [Gammaproteobacteria bacterium]